MRIRLVDIAHARSGDKGDTANVGVIALEPRWYEVLEQFLTRKRVADHFRGMIDGDVERYELPNLKPSTSCFTARSMVEARSPQTDVREGYSTALPEW